MTVTIKPARRTLARGLDPSDDSYSVTAILPDIPLCDEHAESVREGKQLIGWCDNAVCRTFGEIDKPSPCGDMYKKLIASKGS
ncbi:MAG: hypothetical protein WAM97_08285 [Acidimicrobiales bacterium]